MPLYPLTYVLVIWYGYITALSFVGSDGFFMGFCFYLCTLLKALQRDLTDILEYLEDNSFQESSAAQNPSGQSVHFSGFVC